MYIFHCCSLSSSHLLLPSLYPQVSSLCLHLYSCPANRFISTIFLVAQSCLTLCDPMDCSLGEGNGTPLQYSCLENPMDGGAYSPWGLEESDTTERLHFHFPLSCIGEGNGNPLQCSCLENSRDGGACWAAVYGVAQSRT